MSGIEITGAEQSQPDEMEAALRTLEAKASEPRPAVLPDALTIAAIERLEVLFQPRGETEQHIMELRRGLKRDGALAPLTVFQAGSTAFLVDGHHRWTAYKRERFAAPVPVVYFEGSAEEAVTFAGEANSQDKQPMTTGEKSDYAWRLVRCGRFSKSQTARASGTSKATVATMRRVKEALGPDAGGYATWWQAKAAKREQASPKSEDEWEAEQQRKADVIAGKLYAMFYNKLVKNTDVAAMALASHFGNQLGRLAKDLRQYVEEPEEDEDSDF
ncbi:ParB/RepB/Spo0J family partition protein [Lichenibacterium dinghuense]|uniref:ParB/RepB/Spo0J family partition protein n=1 Tax=Lichenibacterium dinghuense TaxID=2895977 RepID=UPI001F42A98F|nr:ParB/RepB/Spo0J family partition protein [Lichenibacterium sp. 6Y81]